VAKSQAEWWVLLPDCTVNRDRRGRPAQIVTGPVATAGATRSAKFPARLIQINCSTNNFGSRRRPSMGHAHPLGDGHHQDFQCTGNYYLLGQGHGLTASSGLGCVSPISVQGTPNAERCVQPNSPKIRTFNQFASTSNTRTSVFLGSLISAMVAYLTPGPLLRTKSGTQTFTKPDGRNGVRGEVEASSAGQRYFLLYINATAIPAGNAIIPSCSFANRINSLRIAGASLPSGRHQDLSLLRRLYSAK
jgi:hypothetical protein